MTDMSWRADPLEWGHGPRVFEVFLEPTCPFSVRAFGKLDALLAEAGPDKITIKLRLQSQPWHMYSGVVTRCVIAASTLSAGKEAAKAVLASVAAHREEFEFERHAGGPNMKATPDDIIARLEGYSGLNLAAAFAIPNLDREIKWHCKYARQNGIHVSPTFMIDGVVQPNISSGDNVSDWAKHLLAA
jgi:protein-disulfide isomerase